MARRRETAEADPAAAAKKVALTEAGLHPDNAVWAGVLRELRLAKGLPLGEVAARTGLSWQAIRKIEEGDCRPRVDSVLRMCGALEMPFLLVAMLVELRSEGVAVPLARLARRRRTVRRIFRKLVDFPPPTHGRG